jgi:hypothetical protein
VSGDEDDRVVVLGNCTHVAGSLQVPFPDSLIVTDVEGDINDLEAAVRLVKILSH